MKKVSDSSAPLLSVAYNEFLNGHTTNQKKLETFRKLFIGFVGDKKIDQLTQIEVNEFFFLLIKCPGGRGGNTGAFNELSIHERIAETEKNGGVLMGLSTFKNTYVGAATQFFKWLNLKYAGIAPVLTTSHIDYKDFGGKRAKGEEKQRALRLDEVERLMNGFPINPKTEHQFWLMMIALFSGARVNEICQLNPQHDIIQDEKTGIWYFNLTNESEGGVGVKKSHKNESSKRKVPVHSTPLGCGFLDYLKRIRGLSHDRIFNGFKPKAGKASYYAEEFFRKYLEKVGLRNDKTMGKKVLGMHSLRSTFMSHTVRRLIEGGISQSQAISNIQPIVGHSEGMMDENGKDLSITAVMLIWI